MTSVMWTGAFLHDVHTDGRCINEWLFDLLLKYRSSSVSFPRDLSTEQRARLGQIIQDQARLEAQAYLEQQEQRLEDTKE